MYGTKLDTEYGRTEGRHRSVVGSVDVAPAGNVTYRIGKALAPEGRPDHGYECTEYVVLTPAETVFFLQDQLRTLLGHEQNRGVLGEQLDDLTHALKGLDDAAGDLKEIAEREAEA
jgi:hypothetical protein